MRVQLTDQALEVRLAWWQKILGLMRNIVVPLAEVGEAEVVADAVREAMGGGLKVGLRLPWLYYVARTIRLDEAFVVRRGVPGLAVQVRGDRLLRRVVVSTPEAEQLAARLRERG